MTADSMHASHRAHQAGRSATSGAGGHELPWRSSTTPSLPRVRGVFFPKAAAVPPTASVGNLSATVQLRTFHLAGPTARLPEMVGRKFLASSHEPGSQTARDVTHWYPDGPSVGSDPPRMSLSHALKHRSGNVPDQRNVFTFAEIQDGRRT